MTTTFTHGLDNFKLKNTSGSIVTVGTFDGIHRGHQEILRRVREIGQQTKSEAVLVTFHPHPRVVVSPNDIPMLLTTVEEKEKFIPDFFDGQVLILKFDDKLQNMTAEDFVKSILLKKINTKKLIVGYDHAFGKNRSGNISHLKELGKVYDFEVEVVGPVYYEDEPVSSSRIRKAIKNGNYREARLLLGHDYAIYGVVEKGLGLGKRLGYPTANIRYSARKLLPPYGVYACWAQIGEKDYNGMMFIGQNNFNPAVKISVEANLFDFDEDIYGQEIIVYPTTFIRKNEKYGSTERLIRQLENDKEKVYEIIERGEN